MNLKKVVHHEEHITSDLANDSLFFFVPFVFFVVQLRLQG